MNCNLAIDPFATNEMEFTAVFAATKARVEGRQIDRLFSRRNRLGC